MKLVATAMLCLLAGCFDGPTRAAVEFEIAGDSIRVSRDGLLLLDTKSHPFVTATACDVSIAAQGTESGGVVSFEIHNGTGSAQRLPTFQVSGFTLTDAAQWVDPDDVPHLVHTDALKIHPASDYPSSNCYSPITGYAENGMFISVSMLYDVIGLEHGFNVISRWEKPGGWRTAFVPEETADEVPAMLPAGATRRYAMAIEAVATANWVTGFGLYRDHFWNHFGSAVHYEKDLRPTVAISLGTGDQIAPGNPRGYSTKPGIGRLDLVGWGPFVDGFLVNQYALGYRRVMYWQSAGSYAAHPECNMVFEIGTEAAPGATELQRLKQAGVTVGFWMGRATSISGGYDLGIREPFDLDNPTHVATWRREIDAARSFGVGAIGLDDTASNMGSVWKQPSWYLYRRFFPWLKQAYPDLDIIIEPAACDFMHTWGPSFVWDMSIAGPPEFNEYLLPGCVVHGVMKRDRMAPGIDWADPARNAQLRKWGYAVINFGATFPN